MIEGKTKLQRWKNLIKNPKLAKDIMLNITPLQQLHARLIGTIGTIAGLIFAWVFMIVIGKMWYFSIVMFFGLFLSVISYIGIRQQYIQTKKMIDEINNINNLQALEEVKNGENKV